MRNVYINKVAVFLPNKPVSNEEMEIILVSLLENRRGFGLLSSNKMV